MRLLDDVPAPLIATLLDFIAHAKVKLSVEIEEEHRHETRFDRANDERFE